MLGFIVLLILFFFLELSAMSGLGIFYLLIF